MATAYAALVSVLHLIEQIQHHPRPPISLDQNQVQSLTDNVAFLQRFLEVFSHVHNENADRLQSRIANAAYAAEDVIESHIVNQIFDKSRNYEQKIGGSTVDLYQGLQKVIQDLSLISEDVMDIQEKMGTVQDIGVQRSSSVHIQEKMGTVQDIEVQRSSSVPTAGPSRSSSKGQNIMVGLDGALIPFMDKLTGYQSSRQIIQIVGMGGIGKTTLARNAYEHPLIVQYFDIRAWVTISREYSIKEILLDVLSRQKDQEKKENLSAKSEEELGEKLYKILFGRRYLIIMDDVWNIEVWDNLKLFLPDNDNGSRIVTTTRLSINALPVPSNFVIEMNFLDEESSWTLLSKIVFGEDGCPLELEEIGKQIARNCKGLPLSIVVIGGLLAKSKKTIEYWEDIAENLNSIVNLEDNERCFKLLHMSYNHLPVHLKPCFLYMGVFREGTKIRITDLIKLWVAEGFLKPVIGKSWEEVAEECLKDLVDRNLILIRQWNPNGKMKSCQIHDLMRDLCLREAHKEKFLCVAKPHSFDNFLQRIIVERRIAIHGRTREDFPQAHDALQFASLARSLIRQSPVDSPSRNSRLLRVLKTSHSYSKEDPFSWQVNLRCLVDNSFRLCEYPSSIHLLWNLQTLISRTSDCTIEIWRMPLLRHVKLRRLFLPDHPDDFSRYSFGRSDNRDDFVLGNLQTLSNVVNFRCSEKVIKMIPNIKKLRISYDVKFEGSHFCLNNLARLPKLESLSLDFDSCAWPNRSDLMQNLSFPHSVKNLTLKGCNLNSEDISVKVGALPILQVLKMKTDSFQGPEWETIEGQFLSLKILQIEHCSDLKCWTTNDTHFPRLEHLVLISLHELKEIPSAIGDISTLQSIELRNCSDSIVFSAKDIVKEQEELGNESLQLLVIPSSKDQVLSSLASHNFQVQLKRFTFPTDEEAGHQLRPSPDASV